MTEVPRNPYITGGPLADPAGVGFYGRRDIYDFVKESLNAKQRNPILLYGQRRIGKTSILRQMPNYLPGDLVIVYFDLQGKALKPLDEVLFMLARDIRRHTAIKDHLDEVRREDVTEDTFATNFLPRVFDVLGGDKYRLVLLFDEMDVIDAEQVDNYEVAAYTFREYMRTLMDEEQQVGYIFVVGRRPEELEETFNAQLFRGAIQKRIGHLSRVEVKRLITELSQGYLLYPPETLDAIYALTDGHPFCTQLICQQLWNHCLSGQSQYPIAISPNDVEETVLDALIYGKNGLNWMYDGLTEPAHRLFLSSAAEVVDMEGNALLSDILDNLRQHRIFLPQPELQEARSKLVDWRILEPVEGNAYRFKVEMIRQWIATDRSLEQIRHEARFISRRAYRLYGLADEYRQEGQLEDAIENYEKALEIYPQLIDAQLGLADALRQKEDWPAAIEAYERLLELDPSWVGGLQETLLEYGSRFEKEGQIKQAIQQYERAAELVANPRVEERLERTARNYGRMLTEQGRFDEALSLFERRDYEDEVERVEKARLAAWSRVEAQVNDLIRRTEHIGWRIIDLIGLTEQSDWEKAYTLIQQYQGLNPDDENAKRFVAELEEKYHELRWQKIKGGINLLLQITGVVGSILLFANELLKWIKNPQIVPSALLVSLIIIISSLSLYIYRHRKSDKRQFTWIAMLVLLLAFAVLSGVVFGFGRGYKVKSATLTPTPTRAPTPTILPAVDDSTYNFEQGLQGWEIGSSRTGRLLGSELKRTSEEAFAGSYALKFEQHLELEAPTVGIGRVKSAAQLEGNELVIAYVKIPRDAPANVGAAFFTYRESNGFQMYTDDIESEILLKPDYWSVLVWEVPSDNNGASVGIGLKFRLVPKEEFEWSRGSEFAWEEGVFYIDAIQIIRRLSVGQLPVELPTEPPTSTPTATPSPETPTGAPTPVALATTPSPPSTGVLTAVVTAEALNLRAGPGIGYAIIRTLTGGEALTLLGRTSNGYWLHVITSKQEEGWLNASYVDLSGSLDLVPAVTATPTRTLLDAPAPLSPLTEYEAVFVNQVELQWRWTRPLAESEYFSVRVSRQDTGEVCFHDKTQKAIYSGPLPDCNSGKLVWEIVAVRLFSQDPEIWLELSPSSEPQLFHFVREVPVSPTDTPAPETPGYDDDDGNGGGDGPICPPPC